MALTQKQTAYIQIHIAVILFGFTAILGDLIEMPAIILVWWRVMLTSFSLLFLIQMGKKLKDIPRQVIKTYAIIGIIIGLHWICFYGSIKLANASIALICMSTTSLFTSLLEPFMLKTKFNTFEVLISLAIIPGMVLVVNNVDISYLNGVWVGLLSAFLAAIFTILNKKNIANADPYSISFIELTSASVMMSLLVLVMWLSGYTFATMVPTTAMDWLYLLVLVLLCTTLAQVLSLKSLTYLSTFASNLVVNLEPVYGILLAVVILREHEKLSTMFYIGAAMIVVAVLSYPFLDRMLHPKNNQ